MSDDASSARLEPPNERAAEMCLHVIVAAGCSELKVAQYPPRLCRRTGTRISERLLFQKARRFPFAVKLDASEDGP